jgi:hypothetical protein
LQQAGNREVPVAGNVDWALASTTPPSGRGMLDHEAVPVVSPDRFGGGEEHPGAMALGA